MAVSLIALVYQNRGAYVRGMWRLVLLSVLACSDGAVASGARPPTGDSSGAAGKGPATGIGKELIPAEWTVFEDTSENGEVTTASLQLPAARDIEGLLREETPRLLLRCVDGKVEASIDTAAGDTLELLPVPIQLDSAPPCE